MKKSTSIDSRAAKLLKQLGSGAQNDYDWKVIGKGDLSSDRAVVYTKDTWKNHSGVEVLNKKTSPIPVIHPREGKKIVVFTNGGRDLASTRDLYINSAFHESDYVAQQLDAEIVGYGNVLDFKSIDDKLQIPMEAYHHVFKNVNARKKVMLSGETAVLDLVTVPYNLTLTSIGYISDAHPNGRFTTKNGVVYTVFDSDDLVVTANSDGNGTKLLNAQQLLPILGSKILKNPIQDTLAMLIDDSAKRNSDVKAVSVALDIGEGFDKRLIPIMRRYAKMLGDEHGCEYTLQVEHVGNRISGFGNAAFNMGGTAVCLNDRYYLTQLPHMKVGQTLMAIDNPLNRNGRSNGWTDKLEGIYRLYGRDEWVHAKYAGVPIIGFATNPTDIQYSLFRDLFTAEAASWTTHFSGGGMEKRLAGELQRLGLYADISNLPSPDPMDYQIMDIRGISEAKAYGRFSMGIDGVVATDEPEIVKEIAASYKKRATPIGIIEQRLPLTGAHVLTPRGVMLNFTNYAR